MASTFSTSLRLELMATGDQSGTWGDTTNTNLGTLLEQAITGVLSVAQGDVANLTLTSLDGTSDQARNAVINVTGAMTAARNVVVPTANKLYLAKNSTTGGFAVTFKTAAGTGVSVAAGTAQWVYCDGTNVVQGLTGTLAAQAAANVAITGGTITGLTSLDLTTGGVISWNTNDVTITHSANLLAFAGASSGYTFDVPIAAASGGTGFASYATGDLLYASGATAFTKLAKGTAGQVLTMNAGATAPEWKTASSGGWTQIGTTVTPSGGSVIITSIPEGYQQLAIRLSRVEFSAAETLQLKVSVNNGSSYATAVPISAALGSGTVDVTGLVIIDWVDPDAAYVRTIIPNTVTSAAAAFNTPGLANVTGNIDAIRLDGVGGASFDGGKVQLWGIK